MLLEGSEFDFLKKIPFINFFKNNFIDVPLCFKHSKSLRRHSNKGNIVKFVNYIMRDGKKTKVLSTIVKSMSLPTLTAQVPYGSNSWKNLFLSASSLFSQGYRPLAPTNSTKYDTYNRSTINSLYPLFFRNVNRVQPLFLMYIYKVDKSIFKNSRGKSGKFTFIWKYITSYKRKFIVFHWLNKELKITNGKTLSDRLGSLVSRVTYDLKSTWIYRIRKFSYNYVYRNCKNNLARTYRTSTR